MTSHYKTNYTEIWLEDGIIHVTYAPQVKVTLEMAKESVQARLEISNGRSYPFYGDTTNVLSVDEDAKKYLTSGEALEFISAGAFLINNPIVKMLGTAMLLLYRPPIPVKFFTNYEKAIQWLVHYKHIN